MRFLVAENKRFLEKKTFIVKTVCILIATH